MMQKRVGLDFSNQKFYQRDFSNQNLQYANFRLSTCIECNFSGADLRYANFDSGNCYRSNFTNAIMYRTFMPNCSLQGTIFKPKDCFGITLTWKCETFMDMEVDETWMKVWLFMPSLMKLPTGVECAQCKKSEYNNCHIRNNEYYDHEYIIDASKKTWSDKLMLFLGTETWTKMKAVFNRRII